MAGVRGPRGHHEDLAVAAHLLVRGVLRRASVSLASALGYYHPHKPVAPTVETAPPRRRLAA